MAWFSKICCSDPRYCKSETIPYCTCKHTGNNVFTEIENIPVIGYYKFTIDSGKALTFWFSKSLQYSSGLYTKYISFLYKIPNIHRLSSVETIKRKMNKIIQIIVTQSIITSWYFMGDAIVFSFVVVLFSFVLFCFFYEGLFET